MIDFINTDKFRDLANYYIMLQEKKIFDKNILKNNSIIYCDIKDLGYLFSNLKYSPNKYILITGSSDTSTEKSRFNLRPNCIRKWFTANATYDHPDLIPIPLGLIPHKYYDAGPVDPETKKSYSIWFAENIEKFNYKDKDINNVYCNWKTANNLIQRKGILQKLKNNKIKYWWGREEEEEGTVKFLGLSPYIYYEQMAKCKFVISPPGTGIDCHRTWEALYMGSFPIVIKNNIYKDYEDLPIIQVSDYSEVTYNLLHSYLNKEYNYEKIYMQYWKKRILNEFNNL